ncbi:hypothetical protein PENPOL_c009G05163 [Penicillium polonicum]|uniref:AMP-dependent synthetase/ligase domain-containing protein n=1 Tax=Penicillium polonicum TaxID=60169 RepID=A0A1V6NG07_PENPO|nr:hypothetical protein PENPOL_c009G05163 [Penicillium polonicum]
MLASLDEYLQFTPEDTFLQQSSLAFDLSIVQTFSALCAGAKLCIAEAQLRKDPTALADFMRDKWITVTYFTPTHYRIAMFGGERLPARLVKAFYDATVPGTVCNTWSPSELVVQTTIHKVEYPNESSINITIGSPLPNCRHYIVDSLFGLVCNSPVQGQVITICLSVIGRALNLLRESLRGLTRRALALIGQHYP